MIVRIHLNQKYSISEKKWQHFAVIAGKTQGEFCSAVYMFISLKVLQEAY